MILLGFSIRNLEWWQAAVLSLGAIGFAFSLSSYYYVVFLAFGFLLGDRKIIGIALCGFAALSNLALLVYWSGELTYIYTSLGAIAFAVLAASLFVGQRMQTDADLPVAR